MVDEMGWASHQRTQSLHDALDWPPALSAIFPCYLGDVLEQKESSLGIYCEDVVWMLGMLVVAQLFENPLFSSAVSVFWLSKRHALEKQFHVHHDLKWWVSGEMRPSYFKPRE
jgi:hypothetical protein